MDLTTLKTLHVLLYEPEFPGMIGTEFVLLNISDAEIEKAKALFLYFSGNYAIDTTQDGDIYPKKHNKAYIFFNGVKVAEEDNFIFDYNITSLTPKIRKTLNRERNNVGRASYTDRIKNILLSSSEDVAKILGEELELLETGRAHDEVKKLARCSSSCSKNFK